MGLSSTDRVAVVAVHGIADQRAGQTVREITRLLCHGGAEEPRYVQAETHEVLVPVTRLEPGGTVSRAATRASTDDDRDLGLALNDYLLGRLDLPERDALYESTRISLRRRATDRPVDIFELYWADLSRLGEGGWRALSGLYQLFFHLETLAADIVGHVSLAVGRGMAWGPLPRLPECLAWVVEGPGAVLPLSIVL